MNTSTSDFSTSWVIEHFGGFSTTAIWDLIRDLFNSAGWIRLAAAGRKMRDVRFCSTTLLSRRLETLFNCYLNYISAHTSLLFRCNPSGLDAITHQDIPT